MGSVDSTTFLSRDTSVILNTRTWHESWQCDLPRRFGGLVSTGRLQLHALLGQPLRSCSVYRFGPEHVSGRGVGQVMASITCRTRPE